MKARPWTIFIWILCLSILAVGAKNFEDGLSLDGPLYASIARQMARTGELFYMDGLIPDFQPFAEHPHLGFWLHAIVFKILPAADWTARIPSHLFYISFLFFFFFWLKKISGEWVATISVLLLWIWPVFSNWASNAYLDPGALFFGMAALSLYDLSLEKRNWLWAFFSGALLGLCTLYKGLTVLGFGPLFLYLTCQRTFRHRRLLWSDFTFALSCLGGLIVLCGIYLLTLKSSAVPNFVEIYWSRQVTQRFGKALHFQNFFNLRFIWILLKDTHFLLPLAFFAASSHRQGAIIPFIALMSFYLLYAPTERVGGQYWILVLPWAAWLVALGLEQLLTQFKFSLDKLRLYSARLAIVTVCFIQYTPIPTHSRFPPGQVTEILILKKLKPRELLVLGLLPMNANFVNSAAFAWYADMRVAYNLSTEALPAANPSTLYLNFDSSQRPDADLVKNGWCLQKRYSETSLWKPCSG